MNLTYLGTGSAEGVPALFCKCEVCQKAQQRRGREIRTRTQALINQDLLIDFPGDSYFHFIQQPYDLAAIEHLLITHSHADHFYPEDLAMRMTGYSNGLESKLTVYGNERVHQFFDRALDLEGFRDEEHLAFEEVEPFVPITIKGYTIIPLLADHDPREKCFIYQISDGDKQLLYAHDTGYFRSEVWKYWQETKPYFQIVSLDCNHQKVKVKKNHMSFYDDIAIKEKMLMLGYADEKTLFAINHFSHNGGLNYQEMAEWAYSEGFITAYDGLQIEV